MKRLLILYLILISCSFISPTNYYATTWAGTQWDQTVSQSALNNAVSLGYFEPITTVPTGVKQLTKSEVASYIYVVNSGAYAAKASNQLVVKNDLIAGDPPTATLTIEFSSNTWTASITKRIYSTDITIYGHGVRGFSTTDCTGGAEEGGNSLSETVWEKFTGGTETVVPLKILAGYTGGNQTVTGMTCASARYKMNATGYFINGTSRSNGAVFTIGGTTVTLVISATACTPYPC